MTNKAKLITAEERYKFIIDYLAGQYKNKDIPTEIDKKYISDMINEIAGKEQYSRSLEKIFNETGILDNPVKRKKSLVARFMLFQIRHSKNKYNLVCLIK